MVEVRQIVVNLVLTALVWWSSAPGPKFYPDDPISAMPAPLPVGNINHQEVNDLTDFWHQSKSVKVRQPVPAAAVNTLGDVPNSEWFTNRQGLQRMTREELQRGNTAESPVPPYTITGGKSEGVTLGFRFKDSRGKRYFVKGDPIDSPELATAADVIVSKLLYAIGYNTPSNEILPMKLSDLLLADSATMTLPDGRTRHMTWIDVETIVKHIPHYPDGSFRVIASLAIEGDGIGPFRYEGVRPDDPNDIVPHENRRDLRALYVFSAWFNNTDVRANNTLDTVVEENGTRFIRHYLLDFGSALGSDGLLPKEVRLGNRFMLPTMSEATERIVTVGLVPAPWERTRFPKLRGIGNFDSVSFRPDRWKSEYPNPALLSSQPDDDFWAAKQVMSFTDDDIRAIVETAKFTDPRSTDYMTRTLSERRDKIGRTFFSKILPLDRCRVENEELLCDDLSVQYGFHAPRHLVVQWSRFDNISGKHGLISGNATTHLPTEITAARSPEYFSANIQALNDPLKPVTIYLRKEDKNYKLVGIDRTW